MTEGSVILVTEGTDTQILITEAIPGPQGVPGPPGTSSASQAITADGALSGHRVVTIQSDGTARYATAATIVDAARSLLLTISAISDGATELAVTLGTVTEPSWAWTPGLPLYLGLNGVLTQTPPAQPTHAFLREVAMANAPTSIVFNPQTGIVLT